MRRFTIGIQKKTDNGFIASITIFIVLAIVLLSGLSFGLLAISEMNMSLEKTQSSQAYFLANLCTEQALMKLKENVDYSGSEIINFEGGNCQILPIEGKWTVKILSNFQNQIKKTKIIIAQVNPKMIISSWLEVADF
jgi:nitrate/TMAO reductase-like tetraheme cytochrome c subunit